MNKRLQLIKPFGFDGIIEGPDVFCIDLWLFHCDIVTSSGEIIVFADVVEDLFEQCLRESNGTLGRDTKTIRRSVFTNDNPKIKLEMSD